MAIGRKNNIYIFTRAQLVLCIARKLNKSRFVSVFNTICTSFLSILFGKNTNAIIYLKVLTFDMNYLTDNYYDCNVRPFVTPVATIIHMFY